MRPPSRREPDGVALGLGRRAQVGRRCWYLPCVPRRQMNVQRTSLWRRLGSIAGLGLAVASALVLAGSAPGAQLASDRSSDAQADLAIAVNHQPEPACVARFNLPCNLAYDVVGFHMLITNPSDSIAQGVGITVQVPPSDWIGGCTPYSPPPQGE